MIRERASVLRYTYIGCLFVNCILLSFESSANLADDDV